MSDKDLIIQITDYLFEEGHTINRPLIMDIAKWVAEYGSRQYEQGRLFEASKTEDKL